jgi:hypothetical protein
MADPTEADKCVTRTTDNIAQEDKYARGKLITVFEGQSLNKIKEDCVATTGQPLNTTANKDRIVYNAYLRHHTAPRDR